MEDYSLITKSKHSEVINTVRCNNFEEAVRYFAGMKKLPIVDLLAIFDVAVTTTVTTGGSSRNK